MLEEERLEEINDAGTKTGKDTVPNADDKINYVGNQVKKSTFFQINFFNM